MQGFFLLPPGIANVFLINWRPLAKNVLKRAEDWQSNVPVPSDALAKLEYLRHQNSHHRFERHFVVLAVQTRGRLDDTRVPKPSGGIRYKSSGYLTHGCWHMMMMIARVGMHECLTRAGANLCHEG